MKSNVFFAMYICKWYNKMTIICLSLNKIDQHMSSVALATAAGHLLQCAAQTKSQNDIDKEPQNSVLWQGQCGHHVTCWPLIQVNIDDKALGAAIDACKSVIIAVVKLMLEKGMRDTSYKRRTAFAVAGGYPVLLACLWSGEAEMHSLALYALTNAIDVSYKESSTRLSCWYATTRLSSQVEELLDGVTMSTREAESAQEHAVFLRHEAPMLFLRCLLVK